MSLSLALAVIVLGSSSVNPELCRDADNKIEPDMRILESDLSQSAAVEASEKLKGMIARGELTGEFQFGALNQSKIIQGHILLRQADADRQEFGPGSLESRGSTESFCTWLGTEGFWYD